MSFVYLGNHLGASEKEVLKISGSNVEAFNGLFENEPIGSRNAVCEDLPRNSDITGRCLARVFAGDFQTVETASSLDADPRDRYLRAHLGLPHLSRRLESIVGRGDGVVSCVSTTLSLLQRSENQIETEAAHNDRQSGETDHPPSSGSHTPLSDQVVASLADNGHFWLKAVGESVPGASDGEPHYKTQADGHCGARDPISRVETTQDRQHLLHRAPPNPCGSLGIARSALVNRRAA